MKQDTEVTRKELEILQTEISAICPVYVLLMRVHDV